MKISITLEGGKIQEIVNVLKKLDGQHIATESYESFSKKLSGTKLPAEERKNKPWTDFEINYLRDNYKSKKVTWIAKALRRNKTAVHQKLFQMYKNELTKKNNHKFKNL